MYERLTIGEFSRFSKVTIKTLRHYERMRLLVPSEVDELTRYRYYTVSQMKQLNIILHLKEMGFTLEEVRALQEEGTSMPSLGQLEAKINQTEEVLDALHERLDLLRRTEEAWTKLEAMEGITLQSLPEMVVAAHHHRLPRREDMASVYVSVMEPELQQLGCKECLPPSLFVMEHDNEFKDRDVDADIFVQVENLLPDSSLVKFRILPEVPAAACIKAVGPFSRLSERNAELNEYLKEHGFQVCGPRRIQFVECLWNQKNPEKWLSVIQVPVTRDKRPRLTRKLLFRS